MSEQNNLKEIPEFNDLPDYFYKTLINSIGSGVYLVNRDRKIVYWNQTAKDLSGFSSEEVMGRWCGDKMLEHVDFDGNLLCGSGCPLQATMADGKIRSAEVFMKHKEGHRVPISVQARPVHNRKGDIIGAVETFVDITPDLVARRRIEQLSQEANTDPLTGVTNRRAAEQVLEDCIALWARDEISFGILFVDMDDLKKINDQLGHEVGDAAIKVVAKTLRVMFRQDDVVARWGGDEFVVILKSVDEPLLEKLAAKANNGIGSSRLPNHYNWGNLSVSIGSTLIHEGDSPKTMMSRADEAMYEVKQRKKVGR